MNKEEIQILSATLQSLEQDESFKTELEVFAIKLHTLNKDKNPYYSVKNYKQIEEGESFFTTYEKLNQEEQNKVKGQYNKYKNQQNERSKKYKEELKTIYKEELKAINSDFENIILEKITNNEESNIGKDEVIKKIVNLALIEMRKEYTINHIIPEYHYQQDIENGTKITEQDKIKEKKKNEIMWKI